MTGRMLPPASGTDQRLDAILDELRGLRADLERAPVAVRQRVDRLADDVAALGGPEEPREPETVELRGTERPKPTRVPRRRSGPNVQL